MAKETLRTQLDTLQLKKQRLEVENVRLRESNIETAALIDAEAEVNQLSADVVQSKTENECLASEVAQLKALYEQLLLNTPEEQTRQADEQSEAEDLNDPAKLINLVARLRGQAFAFYRSCNPEQRSSYLVL